ncbi:hypothetical protein Hanom_Chr15g01412661 [Helianthus anomalus]
MCLSKFNSAFIADYSAPHPQLQHLLVRYDHGHTSKPKYSSVVDDDHTLPNNRRVSLTPPPLVNWLRDSIIIGSCHGLLCLHCCYGDDVVVVPNFPYGLGTRMAVIWNISIRKAIAVVVPNFAYGNYGTHLSFWVCPETSDPKVVKITQINTWSDTQSVTLIPWQVEVFTVSSGVWRCPYTTNLPRVL